MSKVGSNIPLRLAARFLADERGGTAIEYALVSCGIFLVIVGVVWDLSNNIKTVLYDKLATLF